MNKFFLPLLSLIFCVFSFIMVNLYSSVKVIEEAKPLVLSDIEQLIKENPTASGY